MLTIWGRTNSINVQKVLFCCAELGLTYRRIDAGGTFGVTDTPDYISINPNRLVPTIDDDGFHLWESNVIVRYLSQKHGLGSLCPSEITQRFDAERWMDWQATTLWPSLRLIFLGLIRTSPEKRDLAAIAQAEAQCTRALAMLDARLADRLFLGGDALCMADIPAGVSVYRWYALDIAHPPLPHLRRWYESLTLRDGFRDTAMLPLN